MANQRRSVWEIRFRALKQYVSRNLDNIAYIAGSSALDDNLDDEKLQNLKNNKENLSAVMDRANNLETESASEIWLDCDY